MVPRRPACGAVPWRGMEDGVVTVGWALLLALCAAAAAMAARAAVVRATVVLRLLARLQAAEAGLTEAGRRARCHAAVRRRAWSPADRDRQRALDGEVARLASAQNDLRWLLLSERPWS